MSEDSQRTIIIGPADPAFYQALGRFIDSFATAEAVLFALHAYFVGIDRKIAAAVFAGVRVDGFMENIRRIMDVADPGKEPREEIEEIFAQLKEIAQARNDVVHYFSFETSDAGRIVTTATRAHIPKKIRERKISTKILEDMTADVHKIVSHMQLHMQHPRRAAERLSAFKSGAWHDAWRYKRPGDQKNKEPKPGRKDRSRKKSAPDTPH